MNRNLTLLLLTGLAATAAFGQNNQFRVFPDNTLILTVVDSDAQPTVQVFALADSPTQFQVKASTSTGGNWLSLDPAVGTTPAQINLHANRQGLPVGSYQGKLDFIYANGSLLTYPLTLYVCQVQKHPLDPCLPDQGLPGTGLTATPGALAVNLIRGSGPAVASLAVAGSASQTVTVHTSTKDNGNWLTVDRSSFQPPYSLSVTASGQNLPAGSYEGEVDLDASGQPTVKVPVLMHVQNPAAPVTSINPSFVPVPSPDTTFTITGSGFQAGARVILTFSTATMPNSDVILPNPPTVIDSKTLRVVIPGTFLAQAGFLGVKVANPDSATSDPLRLTLGHPAPDVRQNGISNSASLQGDHVAPGQLITIFGAAMGPMPPAKGTVDDSGALSRQVGGVRVLFDGQPAGLLYVSDTQINAVAPNSIGGQSETQIVVEYNGVSAAPVRMPVAAAAPGIFTAAGNGKGALLEITATSAAVDPSPGVARGDIMTFYATGAGLIQSSAGDAMIAKGANKPLLPVSVQIGGQDADVLYAGTSPGQLEVLLQVNVRVPQTLQPGDNVPVDLVVGGFHSQSGVTLLVK